MQNMALQTNKSGDMKPFLTLFLILSGLAGCAQPAFESDVFETQAGEITITFIGHGTLMLSFNGLIIHIDPVGRYADYTTLPKADLILITHHHGDHLDTKAIETLSKESTALVYPSACADQIKGGLVMQNGDTTTFHGIEIKAVAAYNIVHKRDNGEPFHPKGTGNGYVLTLGGKRIYIAGDTENIPEMSMLGPIDIAFLPMNLPYTMTPEMVAEAAARINPTVLYPYHYGETDPIRLTALMQNSGCEVRIRRLQ